MSEPHHHPVSTPVFHRPSPASPRKSWQTWLIGRPLDTADAAHQTIRKAVGLAVFASDALSSTAYATQEMMAVLILAGMGALALAFPLSWAIVGLLTILTISYQQTIHAYPGGGGAYIVARDNLGELPAQIAGAALLTDYILTVAVSISSGVAQLTSANHALYPFRVEIAVILVALIMVINLRGVKESGAVFAVPTYFFLVMIVITTAIGLARYFTGSLGTVADPPPAEMLHAAQGLTLFLVLRAFASGTTALTGVEAISNGIPAFKEPKSRNAGLTLIAMAVVLGVILLGITFLAVQIHAVPSEVETVISQLARTVYGGEGLMYLLTLVSTTLILIMAANTSFADFPRLGALTAADGFLPRQLTFKGSRLVYSRGIMSLAGIAALLIVVFRASVTALIPLYAIGVFLSFTLSQTGMAKRWWKSGQLAEGMELHEPGSVLHHDRRWQVKMVINGFGAVCTAVVMVVFAVTKFRDGAWIILILVPVLVYIFFRIHHHYKDLARRLSLDDYGAPPRMLRQRVIMPVAGVHKGSLAALRYARSLSDDITAVHVSVDPAEAERTRLKWEMWGDGVRLVILDSPYRLLVEPLLAYIEEVYAKRQPNETITIVVPQFVPASRWHGFLHTNAASILRDALLNQPGIVVTDVPYQLDSEGDVAL